MIEVWYCNIASFTRDGFNKGLDLLPTVMQNEVSRYRSFNDRIARLISRLLIRNAIIHTGCDPQLLQSITLERYKKPVLKGWRHFNISHSGDYVVIAFGDSSPLGIDIELRENEMDVESMTNFFSTEEQEFVLNSPGSNYAFFDLWVKKEAVLKASGIGILNGMDQLNCIPLQVNYDNETWNLTKLEINKSYICYLASKDILAERFLIQEISANNLLNAQSCNN